MVPWSQDGTNYWVIALDEVDPASVKFAVLSERLRDSNERANALLLANRALREAKEQLAAANEDLVHFTYIAAHDLQEPCRRQHMLATMLQVAHGHELTQAARDDLDLVLEQSNVMLEMISAFRELTGIAGPTVERTTVPLNQIAEAIVNDVVPTELRGDLTIDLPDEVAAYQPLVRILLQNLLTNAVEHGRHPLGLRLTSTIQPDRERVYTVSNRTSCEAGESRDLLQPFVRGGATIAGSGLGLSICKRVVERHQGRIWLEIQGDEFTVRFTLGKEAE